VKAYTKDELASILKSHAEWLEDSNTGARAYLSRANLSGDYLSLANLSGAYLSGANLSGAYLSGANLSGADLSGADLSRANLSGANLSGASLSEADLSRANLSGANLSGADLSRANLSGAYLSRANLSGDYLSGANLSGVSLSGANLSRANLSVDVKWETYLSEVVPALLTAGGKSLREVLSTGCWDCHSWNNCPMHAAFGAESLNKVPALYRQEAERFVMLFDAGAIPCPVLPTGEGVPE
jgi:hypothetical protein